MYGRLTTHLILYTNEALFLTGATFSHSGRGVECRRFRSRSFTCNALGEISPSLILNKRYLAIHLTTCLISSHLIPIYDSIRLISQKP